jgi:6-pyruvoyltetrahydropterin/6-carboxytetrahydropterin synthase
VRHRKGESVSYRARKTFGPDLGLSTTFRQWRAESHCRLIHGYALGFALEFEADELDARGWVIDFGALRTIRDYLTHSFDHQTLIAVDDPEIARFTALYEAGLISLHIVRATGCEAFAAMVFEFTQEWLRVAGFSPRVRLASVECREHGANSAICQGVS